MRKLFLLLLLLLPVSAFAQVGGSTGVAVSVKTGGTLPATCRASAPAHVFIKTGASAGLYYCSSTNTWTAVGGSGTGTSSTTEVLYNNAGAIDGVSGATSDGTNLTAGSGNLRATRPRITTGIDDANGAQIIGFTPTASADDYLNVTNGTSSVTISTVGADANVPLTISTKGTANITLTGNPAAAIVAGIPVQINYTLADSGGNWTVYGGSNQGYTTRNSSGHVTLGSGSLFRWSSGTDGAAGPYDTQLSRSAAGVVAVNGSFELNLNGAPYIANTSFGGAKLEFVNTGAVRLSTSAGSVNLLTTTQTFSGSSGTQSILNLTPTINQSGTAAYNLFTANVTETATGSGTKNLVQLQVGGTDKFKVTNGGDTILRSIQLTTGTRPACDSTTSGTVWYVAGGAGVADTLEICRKDAADTYAWVTLF